MIRFISLYVFFTSVNINTNASSDFFSRADSFFKKYVANGLVDYKSLKKDSKELDALYDQISGTDLSGKSEAEKKAFYINAYNLVVIKSIVKLYPIKSPLDHAGFFDKEKHKVAGEEITLDILEKKKLISTYGDARFHFALVCAARSCPPLKSEAFKPDKLEEQLKEVTVSALNDNSFIRLNQKQKRVELSKIFEWYKNDFTMNSKSVIDWINLYRKEIIPASYAVGYYEYDWSLNEK